MANPIVILGLGVSLIGGMALAFKITDWVVGE